MASGIRAGSLACALIIGVSVHRKTIAVDITDQLR